MSALQLLFALLSISCWRAYGDENPSCRPTVRNESFTQFMKSMNCEVDKNLLKLFSSDELFNNPYSNFMCIGLMDALTLVPETLCDDFDPLAEIPYDDFCSSSKITTLRMIVNGSVFDNKSNIFIVSKFTEEHCKVLCKDHTNQLCWAFGIIARAVLKHTLLSYAPTTIPTTTVIPRLSTLDSLADVAPSKDGDVDNEDNDSKESDYTLTSTTVEDVTEKVSNNSESVNENPNTNDDDDGKENDKDTNDDNKNNTDTEEHNDQGPTEVADQDYHNSTHPLGDVQVDDNQTLDDTDQAANLDDQGLGDAYQDDHTDQVYDYSDQGDGNDVPSTSTTPLPTEAIATAYLANDYDFVDYDHDYGYGVVDGDDNGYQYLMAILLLIFLLVAAEYLAAHKIKELLSANTSESRGEYMPVDTMEAGLS